MPDETLAQDMPMTPAAPTSQFNLIDFDETSARIDTPNGPMTIARTPGNDSMLGIPRLQAPALDLPAGPMGASRTTAEPPPMPDGPMSIPPELISSQANQSPKLQLPEILRAPKAPTSSGPGPLTMMRQGFKEAMGGLAKEQDAARMGAEAQADAFQLEYEHLMGQQQAQQAFAARQQNTIADIQRDTDSASNDLTTEAERIGGMKVDPDRYYKREGTGARVLHVLASALGAFGSALARTPNYAQQMIDKTIDDDIKAQVHEIQSAKDIFALKRNAIAEKMQRGMTFMQARTGVHYMQLAAAETKLKALMTQPHIEDVTARYEAMLAQIQQRKGALMTQFGSITAQMAAAMAGKRPHDDRFVPRGQGGFYAPSAEAAGKLREGIGATESVKQNIASMRKLLEEHGNESVGEVAKQYEVFRSRIVAGLNKASGLGALDNGSLPFLEAQVPDATAFFGTGGGSLDRLKALEHSLNGEIEAKLKAEGGY